MHRRHGIWISIALVALVIASGTCYYRFVIWPRENFRKVCENPKATKEDFREAIHQLIAWNESHDGFIMLKTVGDESSIPLLIRSLRRIPEDQRRSGSIECTWGHCHDALVAITGEDFGCDAEKWRVWYENRLSEQVVPPNGP